MFEALDEGAIREIVEALVAKAKAGDLPAARLLLTYAVGQPGVTVRGNAVIVQGGGQARTDAGLEPLPSRPTLAIPGSDSKAEVMARRAANGQPLCDPRDGPPVDLD
jgi:hypothetical protein